MKKILILVLGLIAGLLVLAGCAAETEEVVPADDHEEESGIRVEVSRNGFNGQAQGFQIEAHEGDEVKITFVYGDDDFSQNNPHKIIIPAYDIETEVIDENNPEVTVSFTASGHDDIIFMCSEAVCIGHTNLLDGKVTLEGDDHADEEGDEHD